MARIGKEKSRSGVKPKAASATASSPSRKTTLLWVIGLVGIVLVGETAFLFKSHLVVTKDYPVKLVLSFDGANQECGDISPWDLEVSKDWIAVCDQARSRIVLFDHQGNYLRAITDKMAGAPKFKEISCLATDVKNNIYVIDAWNGMIRGFTSLGRPTVKLPIDRCYGPRGIAWDNGNFIVADTGTHRILRMASDGSTLSVYGKRGSEDGMIEGPESVAADTKGNLYVVDSGNNRVVCLDGQGKFIRNFPVGVRPSIVAVDSAQNLLYVSSAEAGFVKVFKTSGEYVGNFTSADEKQPLPSNMRGVRVLPNGDIAVSNQAQVFIFHHVVLNKKSAS